MSRSFDLIAAFILISLVSPFFLLAAAGIYLTSPGPIFFNAKRMGKRGKEFTIHKFRTMNLRSEEGSAITSADDTRIFRFGNFLRATKIDELPQLINILRGEMAFVGPRPEDVTIVKEQYEPWMHETLEYTPGLTSPGTLLYWKMLEHKLTGSDPEKIYMEEVLPTKLRADLDYFRKQSFFCDLMLIFKTAWIVLCKISPVSRK